MTDRIDFTKLLGFQTVSEQSARGIDFKDETIGARLGAKVGVDERLSTRARPGKIPVTKE